VMASATETTIFFNIASSRLSYLCCF